MVRKLCYNHLMLFFIEKQNIFYCIFVLFSIILLSACTINPKIVKMSQVNSNVNKVSYVSDTENYGVSEYYANPDEFYKNGGDCEDYSLAKYYKLKELGFNPNNMWLVSGKMKTSEGDIYHNMLLVKLENNKMYYLDNAYRRILLTDYRKDFTPFFIYNKNGVFVLKNKNINGKKYKPAKNNFYNKLMSVFNY